MEIGIDASDDKIANATLLLDTFSTDAPMGEYNHSVQDTIHSMGYTLNKSSIKLNRVYNFSIIIKVEPKGTTPVIYKPYFNAGLYNYTQRQGPAGTHASTFMPEDMLPPHVTYAFATQNHTLHYNYALVYGKRAVLHQMAINLSDSRPSVTSIVPSAGVRGRLIVISNLSGSNFTAGSRVSLSRTGYPAILATNVTVIGSKKITCTFPIPANAPLGLRNADVRNNYGITGTKMNAFMVKAPAAPTITALQPNTGKRGALVTITNLAGTGFIGTPKPTVQLSRGSVVITGTNVTVVNSKKITCTFKIPILAATGAWNASVINGDNQKGVKASAFTVNI